MLRTKGGIREGVVTPGCANCRLVRMEGRRWPSSSRATGRWGDGKILTQVNSRVLLDCGRVACACRAAACSDSRRLRGWVRGRLHRHELASHSMTFGTGPVAKMSDVGRAEYRIRAATPRRPVCYCWPKTWATCIRASCSSSAQQIGARAQAAPPRRRGAGVGRTRLLGAAGGEGVMPIERIGGSHDRTARRQDRRTPWRSMRMVARGGIEPPTSAL